MKQRVLILQVGNYADDVEFPKISREINEKYAELHGYDYKWETFESGVSFREANKFKFIAMLKYFDQYDIICFLDADAAFVNPAIIVTDFIDDEHYIFMANDGAYINYYNELPLIR